MDAFHFACPHCSSRLRVREKLYVGRQVDCPECGQTLLIVEQSGELGVRPIERKTRPVKTLPSVSAHATSPAVSAPRDAAPDASTKAASTAGTPTPGADPILSSSAVESQPSVPIHRKTKILAAVALGLTLGLIAVAIYVNSSGANSGDDGSPDEPAVAVGSPGTELEFAL